MAFWDDFQKTMSKTAETGIKQTSKWLEVGKLSMSLNAAISMTTQACKALATQEILKALGVDASNSKKSIVLGRGKRLLYLQRKRGYENEAMITIAYNRKENLAANSHLAEQK